MSTPAPRNLISTGLVPDREERLELLGMLGDAVEHGGLGTILEPPLVPAALRQLSRLERDPLRATAALLFAHAGLQPPVFHLTEELHAVHWAAEPDPLDGRPAPAGCTLLPDGRPSVFLDARLARDLNLATPALALLVGHAWREAKGLTHADPLLDGPAGLAAAVYLGLGLVILNGDSQVVLPGDEPTTEGPPPAIHFLGPPGVSLAKVAWLLAAQSVFRGDEEGVEVLPHLNWLAGPHYDEALRTALAEAPDVVALVGREAPAVPRETPLDVPALAEVYDDLETPGEEPAVMRWPALRQAFLSLAAGLGGGLIALGARSPYLGGLLCGCGLGAAMVLAWPRRTPGAPGKQER